MITNILPPPNKTAIFSLLKGRVRTQGILTGLIAAFLLCNSLVAKAKDFSDGDFTFTILTENTCAVKSTTLTSGTLTIPSTASDGTTTYTVTEIADNAFKEKSGFTGTLSIPSTVKEIGNNAFEKCYGFTSLTLNQGLENIGEYAFAGNVTANSCVSMGFEGALVIPSSVRTIGKYAFSMCAKFTSLTLNEGLETIGDDAFSGNFAQGNAVSMNFEGSLVIPKSVKNIGDNAFSPCSKFTSLVLNEGLETIGERAFAGYGYGPSMFIANMGFDCELVLPKSLKKIGSNAFASCEKLHAINLEIENYLEIGTQVFGGCKLTGTLTIKGPRKSIGGFSTTGFNKIILPEGLETLESYAFSSCTNITSIDLPQSLKNIGNGSFSGCSNLASINLPNGLETIGGSAFLNCTALCVNPLIIPEGVTEIQANAFNG